MVTRTPRPVAPAAQGQTRPDSTARVTPVQVAVKRTVTYVFNTTTANGLRIPYAVAVNGAALARFATRPLKVNGVGGRIVESVDVGATVALFLNSDANPSFRCEPVYRVTAGARDVHVVISERTGKHADSDLPTLVRSTATTDEYTAPLTGDIWMRISHRYEASEVAALVPPGTSSAVLAAVQSICNGLPSATMNIVEPATDAGPQRSLRITFNDSQNPNDNIVSYTLLRDGLPRVHPGGMAALFSAAIASLVPSLRLTSCWRPMLGSIAHRAGLGLDVDYVGAVRMNRQELRTGSPDTTNVSAEERRLFNDYKTARTHQNRARDAAAAAPTAENRERLRIATEQATAARQEWDDERDANEPQPVRTFRELLLANQRVAQLFDPWFMDSDGSGPRHPTANLQESANEQLHAHHLHITVREPAIL